VKLLLDTHALLWWLADDERLGSDARALIEDPDHDVLVSMASLWEIVVKIRVGKLDASIGDIVDAVPKNGFTLLPIGTAHLLVLADLPLHHRDPFDHLLIAQSIAENAVFVSEDTNTARYQVNAIPCSNAATPVKPASPR
jgi:PIN domain nuclease of toxin-antitoxin system